MERTRVLLITMHCCKYWMKVLEKAVTELKCTFEIYNVEEVKSKPLSSYALVFIDDCIQDAIEFLKDVADREPDITIVILASSPDWQEAREVMGAGAAYYLEKPLSSEGAAAGLRLCHREP